MTEYVWELGIDWSAVETAGVSYLRGGLVKKVRGEPDALASGTPLNLRLGGYRVKDVGQLWEALVLELGSSPQPTLKG